MDIIIDIITWWAGTQWFVIRLWLSLCITAGLIFALAASVIFPIWIFIKICRVYDQYNREKKGS